MTWSIEVRTVARAWTPGPEIFFQRGFDEWFEIAIHIFVLRRNGRTILVDTGTIADLGPLNEAMRRRKGPRAGFVPSAGAADDLFANPIDAAILTSFGPYAVGGVDRLPVDTPVFVSARGLKNLNEPEEPELIHALPAEIGDRLRTGARSVVGRREVAPGLTICEVGVHHPASMAVTAETKDGPIIIADPIFTRRNLTERIALGAAEEAAAWYRMVRTLGAEGACFMPIHDPDPGPVFVEWARDPSPSSPSLAGCQP